MKKIFDFWTFVFGVFIVVFIIGGLIGAIVEFMVGLLGDILAIFGICIIVSIFLFILWLFSDRDRD